MGGRRAFIGVSSFPTTPLQRLIHVYLFCLSCLSGNPPALGFGRGVIVRGKFRFLFKRHIRRRLLRRHRRPRHVRIGSGVKRDHVCVQMLLLRNNRPYLSRPNQAINMTFTGVFRQETLNARRRSLRRTTVHFSRQGMFISANFRMFFKARHRRILTTCTIVLLRRNFRDIRSKASRFARRFILIPRVVVCIPRASASNSNGLTRKNLKVPLLPRSLFNSYRCTTTCIFFRCLRGW